MSSETDELSPAWDLPINQWLECVGVCVKNDKTLFLLAAPRGAGKSTLLESGFDTLGKILGPNLQDELFETNVDQTGIDPKNFEKLKKRSSYFPASNLMFLRAEIPVNRSYLIHVDTYNVLRNLVVNPDYLTSQQRNELIKQEISFTRRQDFELLDKRLNDILLKNFLKEPFFRGFGRLVNITLHCDYEKNQNQVLERNGKYLFGHPDPSAKLIHSELYDCWKRNMFNLKPFANFDIFYGPNGYEILHSKI